MLVIFDCDGVLVDSEDLVNEIEAALLNRWGWAVTTAELRARFRSRSFGEIAGMIQAGVGPARLPENWMYEWAMETAAGFHAGLRAVAGVRDVLERLREERVPVCVASQSSMARVRLSLALCELRPYFADAVFSADLVARPKPAPDLFLHAARTMGTPPRDCVVIEDSTMGVQAAVAAGMAVLGYAAIRDGAALERAGATVFTEMGQCMPLLRPLLDPRRSR